MSHHDRAPGFIRTKTGVNIVDGHCNFWLSFNDLHRLNIFVQCGGEFSASRLRRMDQRRRDQVLYAATSKRLEAELDRRRNDAEDDLLFERELGMDGGDE